MNTQPMDIYLNRERLTDLAQFAVPDGHDLWPKIERAARASASGMTTQRPGILSLGLSRAWTAVGILLIAATFAALGFGLAVLFLSNGHDQVPATQPDDTVTPSPAPATATPYPALTPDVAFEDSLSSADLARFGSLPVEVQDALVGESLENGNDSALRYLRDMPDDPAPLSAILEPETQSLLDAIDEPYLRELLLEGYPNSTRQYVKKQWLAGDISDLDYHYGNFDMLVREVHKIQFEEGYLLPPLEETISPASLTRFESLDPLLQESFRLVWETTRSRSTNDAASELEQDLLKVPLEMPGIRELGLPSEATGVLEREPELWNLAQRMVAGDLLQDQNWDADDAAILQQTIAAYEAPGGKAALERGLLPGGSDPWLALVCLPPSWGGVPLGKAALPVFRDMHPGRLVFVWPTPEDALSDTALANFNLLDETMLEAFEVWWYGHGLPVEARFMACLIARWDRGLADTPFTSMPGPEVFLPEDKRGMYNELTDHEKWVVDHNLAHDILMGEVVFSRERLAIETEHVSTFDSTAEEFLEGLRSKALGWLCGFHPPACRETDPPQVQTPSAADSWVSENGFIQFTTGDDSFDDPLPGTHSWCIQPSSAPKVPGPWLVPSKLPEGMEPTTRDQMFPHTMYRAFRSSTDHISMVQGLCAIRLLSPVSYRSIPVGDRTAYVVAAVKPSTDGSAPQFDPNVARSLVMDIGYGTVEFNVFGSVTVDELVDMAASLVPEELTDAEKGPYPQAVLDELGTSFGPVYLPGKLPDGYEMFGQLQVRQEALGPRTSRMSYVRETDGLCVFHLSQATLRQQFPNVVQRAQRGYETTYTVTDETGQSIRATAKWGAVEIDGLTIYAQEFSAQPRNQFTDVYFQSQGVWFNLTINTSPYCNHSLKMVAEIASSLEPLQP